MQILIRPYILTFAALLAFSFAALAQSGAPTLFRQPAISKTDIAFSYAGDLWIVSRNGGDARRLTTGIGVETNPYFLRTAIGSLLQGIMTATSMSM